MRKMKNRKITVFIFMAFFCFAMLLSGYGCSKKAVYNPDNFLPSGTESNPYQIVKDPITLKVFVAKSSMHGPWAEMYVFKKLSELTNIKFDFVEVDSGVYTSKRSVAWENKNDLPDLFLFNNSLQEQVAYSSYNAIVPWNKDGYVTCTGLKAGNLLQYMPNYSKLVDSMDEIKKYATLSDGYMYSLTCINDVPRDLTYKYWINKTWIENINEDYNLNLPTEANDITTFEQLIEILTAFKNYDANRNGDSNDEIPYSGPSLDNFHNVVSESMGYVQSFGLEIENDGSKFTYVPSTEQHRTYLKVISQMYKAGLIDSNTYELTWAQVIGKGYQDLLGSFCGAASSLVVGNDLDNKYEYITVGPFTSQYYNENNETYASYNGPIHYGFSSYNASGAVMPTTTPYVREIARLLDILYSDYGLKLYAFGEEGVNWEWIEESKDEATGEYTEWEFILPDTWDSTTEEWRAKITPNVGTGCAMYWKWDFVGKEIGAASKLNQMSLRYYDYLKEPKPTWLIMTLEEYTESAAISASIDTYVSTMVYKFTTGKLNVNDDSVWNNYQATLKNYNYERLAAIYNGALSRYNS